MNRGFGTEGSEVIIAGVKTRVLGLNGCLFIIFVQIYKSPAGKKDKTRVKKDSSGIKSGPL